MAPDFTPSEDFCAIYPPPYTLLWDMLLAVAFCPSAPLRQAFPQMRLMSLCGKTPLIVWFARVKEFRYQAEGSTQGIIGYGKSALYHELMVAAIPWRLAGCVLHLSVDSPFGLHLGLRYGMPKILQTIEADFAAQALKMTVGKGDCQSSVRARSRGRGKLLAKAVSMLLPLRCCPAVFPSGSQVSASILSAQRICPASISGGRISLPRDWLPQPVSLLPIGVALQDLQVTLPPPPNLSEILQSE